MRTRNTNPSHVLPRQAWVVLGSRGLVLGTTRSTLRASVAWRLVVLSSPLLRDQAITVVARSADALASAHRADVMHRGIRPTIVFLLHEDVAQGRLLEFGVAHARHAFRPLTQTGTVLGILADMTHEQARGDASSSDLPGLAILHPNDVVRNVNTRFETTGDASDFFTVVYGLLDTRDGTVCMVQAGHPPPIHQRAAATGLVGSGGYAVGMLPDVEHEELTCASGEGTVSSSTPTASSSAKTTQPRSVAHPA